MIPVTISFGVAASSKAMNRNAESLLKAADEALYRAKENGRNRVEGALAICGQSQIVAMTAHAGKEDENT